MAKKDTSDKLTETGRYQKNYFRARQNDSKAFWDKVDAANHAMEKSQGMAAAYYGDKADAVKSNLNAYGTGDFPTKAEIKNTAAGAKRLEDKVLKDSAAGRSRLVAKYLGTGKAKGGNVKKMAKGGSTASKRADGCAIKGKTKGRFV